MLQIKKRSNSLMRNILILLTGMILFLTGCSKDGESEQERKEAITRQMNDKINADSLRSDVSWLQSMGTRFALADNHREVALKIRNRFRNLGYSDARIDSFKISKVYQSITYNQWQYNVIATLTGRNNPDSVCITGAHYDDNLKTGDPFSIDPGANDNASGVASLLELARVMKKNKYYPGNTLEFIAFGSEELGLLGSESYSVDAALKSKKIKLMLNNDMIAYQPVTGQNNWRVNIMDYDNSHDLRADAEMMCGKYTILKYTNDNTYNKQSDSYQFFRLGYKAIFFFSDYIDPNYHSLADLSENCNFDYCREIVKLCCALLVENN